MSPTADVDRRTTMAALAALSAVNGLVWTWLLVVVSGIFGVSVHPAVLSAVAAATCLALPVASMIGTTASASTTAPQERRPGGSVT